MKRIEVNLNAQRLLVWEGSQLLRDFPVSTASKGAGELIGSEKTPRGQHIIRAKIGQDCPLNTVFIARRPTGEIYGPELKAQYPGRDWILTRILWLSGLEIGKNRLGKVDTMRRFIYIHACPDEQPLGSPASHGCIRMHNAELLDLFDLIPVGTPLNISE